MMLIVTSRWLWHPDKRLTVCFLARTVVQRACRAQVSALQSHSGGVSSKPASDPPQLAV